MTEEGDSEKNLKEEFIQQKLLIERQEMIINQLLSEMAQKSQDQSSKGVQCQLIQSDLPEKYTEKVFSLHEVQRKLQIELEKNK